jgi:hypothetical protein
LPLSGNKGEWSEIYVFLKLLADGRLNAADANLNAIPNVYYPIIKILRLENGSTREYKINSNIQVINSNTNTVILNLSLATFVQQSQQLFNNLRAAQGSSFSFPAIETFLNSIDVHSLTALKTDKADIKVIVHDLNTGLQPKLGFSIKSMLGMNSTLFNAGQTTNFIYEIRGINLTPQQIATVNSITITPKIKNRIDSLINSGAQFIYKDIFSNNLKLNLQLIDSDLPEILAHLVFYKYSLNTSNLQDLLRELNTKNPKQFDLSLGHPFYEYKIKNFLTDSALGMTPATLWTGKYDATGGIIIVKQNGDLVCYHIYNRNEFQDYLLNNTRLEQASTTRYGFGEVYNENGRFYMKLNLQVRFI